MTHYVLLWPKTGKFFYVEPKESTLNLVTSTIFRSKFGPETSKYIVLNQTQSMELFKVVDSEFDNCFLKFHHQITFFVQKMSQKSKKFLL